MLGEPEVETTYRWRIENGPEVSLDFYQRPTKGRIELVKATRFSDGTIDIDVYARKLLKGGEVDPRSRGLEYAGYGEIQNKLREAATEYVQKQQS